MTSNVDRYLKLLITSEVLNSTVLGGYLKKYHDVQYTDVFTRIDDNYYTRSGLVKQYFNVGNLNLHQYRELAIKLGCIKEVSEPTSMRSILLGSNPMLCRIWAITPAMVAALAINQDVLFNSYYEKTILQVFKVQCDLMPNYTLGYLEQILN
jgi:hypothetical protein